MLWLIDYIMLKPFTRPYSFSIRNVLNVFFKKKTFIFFKKKTSRQTMFSELISSYEDSLCTHLMLLTDNGDGGSHYVCSCPDHFVLNDGVCQSNCPTGFRLCADDSACYRAER